MVSVNMLSNGQRGRSELSRLRKVNVIRIQDEPFVQRNSESPRRRAIRQLRISGRGLRWRTDSVSGSR